MAKARPKTIKKKLPTIKRPKIKADLSYIVEDLRPLAVSVKSIHEDPSNSRLHNERNLSATMGSLKRYGQRKPIVVNSKDMTIEAGNGTFESAKKLNWEYIAVVYVEDDSATAIGYSIADNRTAELGKWDLASLGDQLGILKDLEEDLTFTGFIENEYGPLINAQFENKDIPKDLNKNDQEEDEDEEEKEENDLHAVFFTKEQWQAISPKINKLKEEEDLDDAQSILKLVRQRKARAKTK